MYIPFGKARLRSIVSSPKLSSKFYGPSIVQVLIPRVACEFYGPGAFFFTILLNELHIVMINDANFLYEFDGLCCCK